MQEPMFMGGVSLIRHGAGRAAQAVGLLYYPSRSGRFAFEITIRLTSPGRFTWPTRPNYNPTATSIKEGRACRAMGKPYCRASSCADDAGVRCRWDIRVRKANIPSINA